MVDHSTNFTTKGGMKNLFQKFHYSRSLKACREPSECPRFPPSENKRQYSNEIIQPPVTPVLQSEYQLSKRSRPKCRKRDRFRQFLIRRREIKANESGPYIWPCIMSIDKGQSRLSDDETEDGEDVYMVDCHSDSDSESDEKSGNSDDFTTSPVSIPEIYRKQDRLGGVIVAGARILFTYAGYKRQQTIMQKLQSVPEDNQLVLAMGLHHEHIVIGIF